MALWSTLVVTYRPFADGLDRNAYLLSSTVLAWAPCVGYALLRLVVPYGHPLPLLVAGALAFGGSTPHWLRLAATADAAAPRLEYTVDLTVQVCPTAGIWMLHQGDKSPLWTDYCGWRRRPVPSRTPTQRCHYPRRHRPGRGGRLALLPILACRFSNGRAA